MTNHAGAVLSCAEHAKNADEPPPVAPPCPDMSVPPRPKPDAGALLTAS